MKLELFHIPYDLKNLTQTSIQLHHGLRKHIICEHVPQERKQLMLIETSQAVIV